MLEVFLLDLVRRTSKIPANIAKPPQTGTHTKLGTIAVVLRVERAFQQDNISCCSCGILWEDEETDMHLRFATTVKMLR